MCAQWPPLRFSHWDLKNKERITIGEEQVELNARHCGDSDIGGIAVQL